MSRLLQSVILPLLQPGSYTAYRHKFSHVHNPLEIIGATQASEVAFQPAGSGCKINYIRPNGVQLHK